MTMKPYKLVIVDDEASVSSHLLEFIEDYDEFEAKAFLSAESALEAVEREEVHVCIVDMRLPGMDGIEFVRRVKMIRPRCRFIIHTGSIDMDLTDDLKSVGMTKKDLFYKPSDMEAMLGHVAAMLEEPEK